MGGGRLRAGDYGRAQPQSLTQPPTRGWRLSRHSCPFPPSFLRRQEPPPPPPTSFPNSSLPPLRGEARWGVGGHEPATTAAPSPNRPLNRHHEVGASPVIPAPSPRHSCAGRNHHHHPTSPCPNSSLPPLRGEARWGGGRLRAGDYGRAQPQPPAQPPARERSLSRHSCPFPPSFLRRQKPRSGRNRSRSPTFGGGAGRRDTEARTDGRDRLASCLRRNDGKWRRMTQRGRRGDREGAQR